MFKKHVFYNVKVEELASLFYHTSDNKGKTLRNIHFSSSAVGKFFIYKNQEEVAVLFNDRHNLNVAYMHTLSLTENDAIEFKVLNRELNLSADFYLNFEVS